MKLDDVATFVHAVEAGSFAGAASVLGVPKGTVSRRVARLEQALGEELITRHSRLFELTPVGRGLFDRSAGAVQELLRATREIHDAHGDVAGELRVTLPPDLGSSLPITDLISEFLQAHPEISLFVDLSDRMVDLVTEHYDFAFRVYQGQLEDSTVLKGLTMARNIEVRLYASPRYLATAGAPTSPDALKTHEIVGFERADSAFPFELRTADERIPMPIRHRVRFTSFPSLVVGAVRGMGIAPIPEVVAAEHVATGALVPVLPDWSIGAANLALLWPVSRLPHPRRRAFIDFVREHPPFASHL